MSEVLPSLTVAAPSPLATPVVGVRSKAHDPLLVIKVGSASIDSSPLIFDEVVAACRSGRRVLLVVGGSTAIERQYEAEGVPSRHYTLGNGDVVRTATSDDIALLVRAYTTRVIPLVRAMLEARCMRVFVAPAFTMGLVEAIRNRPLKVAYEGKHLIVRDHLVSTPVRCQVAMLQHLLESNDVVCLTAPVAEIDSADASSILNTDADMLAAVLAVSLKADHVRFVTSTPGILRDVANPQSVVNDIFPTDDLPFVRGRMKQKIRAAKHVLGLGIADVAIVGPHTFTNPPGISRVWPLTPPCLELRMLTQAVSINSVSMDESDAVDWLVAECRLRAIHAYRDDAGNFVAHKGDGVHSMLLLGHIDTVPGPWRPLLNSDGHLSARGVVDAKGSLINFVETLIAIDVPPHCKLTVVGAVEEEVSSSKGAFHVRDTMTADAVVIGEPSRSDTVTLGYFGLLKIRILASVPHAHSAGKGIVTASDLIVDSVAHLRAANAKLDPEGISALISTKSWSDPAWQRAEAILNFRVSPKANFEALLAAAGEPAHPDVRCEILRATPAYTASRTSNLAKCFTRAVAVSGVTPRFVVKKGTSDMNTLATRWEGVDMVAYGPGDSALDHTDHEFLAADEYLRARAVLDLAVLNWFESKEPA